MTHLKTVYRESLSLLTDLYQLTMAYGYWKSGRSEDEAVFHLFFRKAPFSGGYTVSAGLGTAIELLNNFEVDASDLAYLSTLSGNDGKPLFEPAFLDYLENLSFACDVDAVPEGTLVFPHAPLLRVRGPLLQAQLIETFLLNIINFQTLVATKAARVVRAAKGEPVLEFGLRRAQGIDGALSATRAAFIGGVRATSNVLAGKLFGIPVRGTHAHSWVMSFGSETEAFETYAQAMPNNTVFLVDTYNTLDGVRNAVETGLKLRAQGHTLLGIRLDSGDLAWLSAQARQILDAAGFSDAKIVASNDLDEHLIESLKRQGAKIGVWGVGTKLATAYDQPALGGVYKLAALRRPGKTWEYKIKHSEQALKTSIPGVLQVRRFRDDQEYCGDLIFDENQSLGKSPTAVSPHDHTKRKHFAQNLRYEDLLVPIFQKGSLSYALPELEVIRKRTEDQLRMFHDGIKRLDNPHAYPVGLEAQLHERRSQLILAARAGHR